MDVKAVPFDGDTQLGTSAETHLSHRCDAFVVGVGKAESHASVEPNRDFAFADGLRQSANFVFNDIFPQQVAVAVEVEAVVAVVGVQLAFGRGERMVKVEVGDILLFGHGLKHAVDDGHILPAFGVTRKKAITVVGGQNALHDDTGARRFGFDALHDLTYVHGNGVVGEAVVHVVGANHEEHHGGLAFGDGLKAVEHACRDVATDATVFAVGVLEQLAPFASIGDAVAEENDVVFGGRHGLKEQLALVVVGAELARDLGETLGCHQESSRKE